jgi:hypothetical protein
MMSDEPPPMATLKELSRLPKADLIDRANRYLKASELATDAAFHPIRAQVFMQELARRSQNRQTWRIIGMTAAMTIMTLVITAMTAVIMVRS